MTRIRFELVALLQLATLLALGCSDLTGGDEVGPVVARVNGQPILLQELTFGQPPADAEAMQERVERQVTDVLVAQEARRLGLDGHASVRQRIAEIRAGARRRETELLREAFIDDLRSKLWIDESETEAYFEQNPERFAREFLTFRIAKFASEDALRVGRERLGDGKLAEASEAKLVGPLQRPNVPAHFLRALDTLEDPGQLGTTEARGDWFLLELVERVREAPEDSTSVRHRIDRILRSGRVEEVFDEQVERLRDRAEIDIYPEVLGDGDDDA